MTPERSLLRRGLAVVLVLVWSVLVYVADVALSLSSLEIGWLWTGALVALGWVLAVLLWRPARRALALVVAVALALGVGALAWHTGPPTHDRIREQADEVAVPAGWQEVADTDVGSTVCFKGCPEVQRTYTVAGTYDEALAAAADAFEAAGWTVETVAGELVCEDGRWAARVTEEYPEGPPVAVEVTFTG